jgi:endonuclease YncB( thermonuclease family)
MKTDRASSMKAPIFVAVLLAAVLSACSTDSRSESADVLPPSPAVSTSFAAPDSDNSQTAVVSRVVDGDTLKLDSGERVRLIGIDTPEPAACGGPEASAWLAAQVTGKRVVLIPGAQSDRDRYDRLLRYVELEGKDLNLALIQEGFARTRYDSRDGYGSHPRESQYIEAEARTTLAVACP